MVDATSGAVGGDLVVFHAARLQSQWTAAILKETTSLRQSANGFPHYKGRTAGLNLHYRHPGLGGGSASPSAG